MSAKIASLGLVAAGLLGLGAYSLTSNKDAPEPPKAAPVKPTTEESPEVPPMKAEAAAAVAKPEAGPQQPQDVLMLPDGSSVPLLNNCRGVVDMKAGWGTEKWSPIVAKEVDKAGEEWYLHEDGTYSQTKMVYRRDLGRWDPILQVARKAAVAPIAPEDIEAFERARKEEAANKK